MKALTHFSEVTQNFTAFPPIDVLFRTREKMSVTLCASSELLDIKKNMHSVRYTRCPPNIRPEKSSSNMNSSELKPFTAREQIIATDFDNEEVIEYKIFKVVSRKWFKYFSGKN